MNLETKITIYKFTPQLFTLTQNHPVRESAEGQSWPDMLHQLIM